MAAMGQERLLRRRGPKTPSAAPAAERPDGTRSAALAIFVLFVAMKWIGFCRRFHFFAATGGGGAGGGSIFCRTFLVETLMSAVSLEIFFCW
jgi:hypothetical protein